MVEPKGLNVVKRGVKLRRLPWHWHNDGFVWPNSSLDAVVKPSVKSAAVYLLLNTGPHLSAINRVMCSPKEDSDNSSIGHLNYFKIPNSFLSLVKFRDKNWANW